MNETELLQAFRSERSEEAFAELVRRYAGLVYCVARRRLANSALAEDITQLVFIRFATTTPNLKSPAELAAWLHRTTTSLTIDTWRSETRRCAREQHALSMQPDTNIIWEEISPKLDEALNELNEEDRQALLLRFFGEKPMREVGAALGISEGAAKMRVGRAVNRLRTRLGVGTAACTAAVLSSILLEQPLQAAPTQLTSRLAAIRLPPAGSSATGGAGALQRILKSKVAATAAVLAVITMITLWVSRPWNSRTNEVSARPAPGPASKPAEKSKARQFHSRVNRSALVPSAKPVKILMHVLDAETGLGLPNTRISAAFFGPGGEGGGSDTVTDQNGDAPIFEPDDQTKKSGPNVFVTAEGHVPKCVGFHDGAVPTDYTIRLDPAVTVSGWVVDEENRPVNEVKIFVQNPGNQPVQSENIDFQTCPVTSHEDGSWSCSYIPKDYTNEIRFILKKPGFAPTFPEVPVREVDLTNLVLVINRGFTVIGKITDAQGNAVCQGVVRILDGDENKRRSAKIDERGFFCLRGVPGDYAEAVFPRRLPIATNDSGRAVIQAPQPKNQLHVDLAVQAKGFPSQVSRVGLSEATNVANFVLERGNSFRGQLFDDAGNPIAHAIIRTDYDFKNQIYQQFEWKTYTDAEGRFEWDSAPTGEVCYWFEAPGYQVIRSLPLIATGEEHRIVLQRTVAE